MELGTRVRGPCQAVEVPMAATWRASACCDYDDPSVVPDAFQAHILVEFVSLMYKDATNNAQNYSKIDK
jgi:hypothetical protein